MPPPRSRRALEAFVSLRSTADDEQARAMNGVLEAAAALATGEPRDSSPFFTKCKIPSAAENAGG